MCADVPANPSFNSIQDNSKLCDCISPGLSNFFVSNSEATTDFKESLHCQYDGMTDDEWMRQQHATKCCSNSLSNKERQQMDGFGQPRNDLRFKDSETVWDGQFNDNRYAQNYKNETEFQSLQSPGLSFWGNGSEQAFLLNALSCFDANNCSAVGEGETTNLLLAEVLKHLSEIPSVNKPDA